MLSKKMLSMVEDMMLSYNSLFILAYDTFEFMEAVQFIHLLCPVAPSISVQVFNDNHLVTDIFFFVNIFF